MHNMTDEHFRAFAQRLDGAIQRHGEMPDDQEGFIARQKSQVEKLDRLEEEFRRALIKHPWGPTVFREFVEFIRDKKRNILDARPFYRERQEMFTEQISVALHKRHHVGLFKFHFNYTFVLFVLQAKKWPRGSRVAVLGRAIGEARTELIEMNAPLAIAQATKFYKKTPRSHMTRMDLIQVAMEGLTSGVDKYVCPYNNNLYRQVLIGRIVGNLIEAYSETMIHFYPSDKRKLYNANKSIRKFAVEQQVDFKGLANHINQTAKQNQYKTTPDEIASLLAASSIVSADAPSTTTDNEVGTESMERYADDERKQPDQEFERAELHSVMMAGISRLSILEQKILRLRGVHVG
jgi:DNA-directed RNA polymerase specialized sigma subunit